MSDLMFQTETVVFLDGPMKGPHEIARSALIMAHRFGNRATGIYEIQWNGENMRWEAFHVQDD
jgi:hypothetical protein